MKKFLLSALLSASLLSGLHAATLDKSSIKINFEGYKTPNMVGTSGTINNVKFKFGKDETSIKGLLEGATATLSPNNIDMGVELITKNIINAFFNTLNSKKDFTATITHVLEGENKGTLSAKITINGQSEHVPLVYTIKDGKFEAKGQLDLSVYKNSQNALKELAKAAPGHAGISWPHVNITILANTK